MDRYNLLGMKFCDLDFNILSPFDGLLRRIPLWFWMRSICYNSKAFTYENTREIWDRRCYGAIPPSTQCYRINCHWNAKFAGTNANPILRYRVRKYVALLKLSCMCSCAYRGRLKKSRSPKKNCTKMRPCLSNLSWIVFSIEGKLYFFLRDKIYNF